MKSAVEFSTPSRIHVALAVKDLNKSREFYATLFGVAPTKERPGYAKFEPLEPPVNLSLNAVEGATAHPLPNHFGIQVKSSEEVESWSARLAQAGLSVRNEEAVACCYAVQDKVWVEDPDGNAWEVFVVLDADVDQYAPKANSDCCSEAQANVDRGQPCCGPACCS